MILNADFKGLEVVTAADLSRDAILSQEIIDKVDIHEANRDRFGLGEGKLGRLIAKIFKFRLIYGGSAYSYANDPDFMGVSSSEKFWQRVIDEYYQKYSGIKKWHDKLLMTAMEQGFIEIPSGRYYNFRPNERGKWPLTTIKNYPVQGFGADLVKLARIEFCRMLQGSGLEGLFIGTVHDSLKADVPEKNVEVVARMLQTAIEKVPELCYNEWSYQFSLPMTCEIKVGPNQRDMQVLTLQ